MKKLITLAVLGLTMNSMAASTADMKGLYNVGENFLIQVISSKSANLYRPDSSGHFIKSSHKVIKTERSGMFKVISRPTMYIVTGDLSEYNILCRSEAMEKSLAVIVAGSGTESSSFCVTKIDKDILTQLP